MPDRLLTEPNDERIAAAADLHLGGAPPSVRLAQERDVDRIKYSSAFARLAGITQVTAPEGGHTFHNRLTHSLKVAQVARRNGERLKRMLAAGAFDGAAARLVESLSVDSAEAAGLGHDLGHPPFGHVAEQELQNCSRPHGADFEGNAQSFRILTRLATRAGGPGLNLTRQTLAGALKYPWLREPETPPRNVKWGAYDGDRAAFDFAREYLPAGEPTLEAELMDWADDLTFAIHDVDDFYRAGLLPLDRMIDPRGAEAAVFRRLLEDAREAQPHLWPFGLEPDDIVAAVDDVLSLYGPVTPYEHTRARRGEMRIFASELIGRYLEAFALSHDHATGRAKLAIDDEAARQVTALKMLTVCYVIRRPQLAVVQRGQRQIVRDLYEWYFTATGRRETYRLLPAEAREELPSDPAEENAYARARIVVDLIAGLREEAAYQLHARMSGRQSAVMDVTAV
jgi:dGTPase